MSRELRQLLRTTAVAPSEPVAPASLIVRARRRRQRRVALSGSGAVVAAVVAVSVFAGAGSAPQPPEITDQPPASVPDPDPDLDLGEGRVPSAVLEVGAIELAEVGRPLLLYGHSGARQVAGEIANGVTSDRVVAAFPDLQGGVVLQDAGDAGGTIQRSRAGDEPLQVLPISADPVASTLRGVTSWTVNQRCCSPIGAVPVRPRPRPCTPWGSTAAPSANWESPDDTTQVWGGVGASDDQLFYTSCHLHCTLYQVPQGSTIDAQDTTSLFGAGEPIQGLDVVGSTAGYIRVDLRPDDSDEPPILPLHDLKQDQRREIVLPRPELPVGFGTVAVDLAPDRDAALISFRHPEQTDEVQTLLIEGLEGDAPRL